LENDWDLTGVQRASIQRRIASGDRQEGCAG
jgi:hypothetical protein